MPFKELSLIVFSVFSILVWGKKTFTLFFITWRYEEVTNVNARVCSLVYYLYVLFSKNTVATGNMDNYERPLAGIDVKY